MTWPSDECDACSGRVGTLRVAYFLVKRLRTLALKVTEMRPQDAFFR